MPIIEYKRHAVNSQIDLQVPAWGTEGGHWKSPIDKTYIGWVPAETDREYYIPDSVTILTKAELNTRLLAIHANTKYQKLADPADPSSAQQDMTNADVTAMSNNWYDTYTGEKE